MRILFPPKTEQSAIAVLFLTAKQPELMRWWRKKETVAIELLQEKRTALITGAVTKGLPAAAAAQAGLDPTVSMKDSGVEWLGKIPEHWEVWRLKHILKAQKGAIKTGPFGSQLQSSEMIAGDIKVYNQRNVLDYDFSGGDNYITLEKFTDLSAFETFPGDLLITTRGSMGRCVLVLGRCGTGNPTSMPDENTARSTKDINSIFRNPDSRMFPCVRSTSINE